MVLTLFTVEVARAVCWHLTELRPTSLHRTRAEPRAVPPHSGLRQAKIGTFFEFLTIFKIDFDVCN